MKKIALHWQILIAIVFALLVGILLPTYVKYIAWMGEVFMRALKMIVIPLVATSIITGIINIGKGNSLGRLGLKTIIYYLSTSILSIVISLLIVNIIKPGVGFNISESTQNLNIENTKSLGRTLIEIVPDNIFKALADNHLLALIFVSILTGVFILRSSGKTVKYFKSFFSSAFEVVILMTNFIISLAPIGIFGMVAKMISEQNDLVNTFSKLSKFFFTVFGSLAIHGAIIIPLALIVIWKINPLKHLKNMSASMLTCLSTASSAAALPLTMDAVQNKSGVSSKVTDFTLPIGATVNMDGTAIYVVSVVMFIAQAKGIDLSFLEQILLILTALLTSIGTAGIPMASLVIITIILDTLGLPYALIALILPVDRPLDMLRTGVNVWSDSCGALIIGKSEGEKLRV